MNYVIIDYTKKSLFLRIKPEIFSFDTGNKLYVFPGRTTVKRLSRAMSGYTFTRFPDNCQKELKINLWCKIIIQTMKEYGLNEIIFCSEKYMDYINLLSYFLNKNIDFSLISSGDCDKSADFFLEQYGLPVRTMSFVRSGLIIYIDGLLPALNNNAVNILDLNGSLNCKRITVSEFIIKNTLFPIAINSLSLLEGALILTGKEIKDIIIKLCIIGTKCE